MNAIAVQKGWKGILEQLVSEGSRISHSDFVAGIHGGSLQLLVIPIAFGAFDIGPKRNKVFVALLNVIWKFCLPALIVLESIITSNWYLLFGIAVWYSATNAIQIGWFSIVSIFSLGYWLSHGFSFENYFTVFSALFLLTTANEASLHTFNTWYAQRNLITDPELYYDVIPAGTALLVPNEVRGPSVFGIRARQVFDPLLTGGGDLAWDVIVKLLGFPVGLVLTALAYIRGIQSIKPDQAGLIMNFLKKGGVGMFYVIVGFIIGLIF